MDSYPLFLRLAGARCVVVGAGAVAVRKVRLLRKAGAAICLVAPEACEELRDLAQAGECEWRVRAVEPADLAGSRLVIAATNDHALNRQVADWAGAAGVLVNVVDDLEASTAITPAIIDRSPLVVAVSSNGSAPVLARHVRRQLEALLPAGLGRVARFAGRWRERVREARPDFTARLRLWERVFEGPAASQAMNGATAEADRMLQAMLDAEGGAPTGEVFLVGAGPGDPDLLTLRALRRMQQADVVLYDRLIGPRVLDLVRRDAERIDVGKRRKRHTLPQDEINQLLVDLAHQGKRVLRLKGGDPFIFGRGGEEIDTLAAAGIPFEVVPGVTAAAGCAAYAGIPLTHRDHAQSVVFVTGHPRADGSLDLDWQRLVAPNQTVVIYMGLGSLRTLCDELQAHGMRASTPVALVENGTRLDQRVVVGSLADMQVPPDVSGPGLIIIGDVVTLRSKLQWFRAESTA